MRTNVDKRTLDVVRLAHLRSLHPFRLFTVLAPPRASRTERPAPSASRSGVRSTSPRVPDDSD